jgi:hypothetical protein
VPSGAPRAVRRTARRQAHRARLLRAARAVASGGEGASEATCTPGSVPPPRMGRGDGHPSEAAGRPTARAADPRAPTTRRCPGKPGRALLFGLAPGRACRVSPRARSPGCGLVSVALVLASRRTGVTRYPASWSPDVPHAPGCPVARNRPVASLAPAFYPVAAGGPESSRATAGVRLTIDGRWTIPVLLSGRCAAPARPRRSPRRPAGARPRPRGAARGPGGSGRRAGAAARRSPRGPRPPSGAPGAACRARH